MEDQTVVKALVNQADEVVDAVGSDFGVQLGLDDADFCTEVVFHFDFERYDGILSHRKQSFLV